MKYPLLLGALIGITNIIPYFGPIFGAIPAALIAASISVKMIIIVVVIVLVLQFLEGNILSPLIIGKSLHMHPIFIMFALLVGGEVGGVIGLIIAVPILAVIKVSVIHARIHFKNNPSIRLKIGRYPLTNENLVNIIQYICFIFTRELVEGSSTL